MPSRTLSQVVDKIRDKLNRGTEYDDAIRFAIANVIDLNRAERLGFNEVRVGLTIENELTDLPGYIMEVDTLRIDTGNSFERLHERTPNWILSTRKSKTYTSEPIYFAVERQGTTKQIRTYPVPDDSYSAEMVCLADLVAQASLSTSWSDDTELAWFDSGFLTVFYGGLAEVLSTHVGGPEGVAEAQTYATLYGNAIKNLRREARALRHSDSIVPVF